MILRVRGIMPMTGADALAFGERVEAGVGHR
jgi:hypothetical protein